MTGRLAAGLLALALLTGSACGGDIDVELLKTLPVYAGAVEIDRHREPHGLAPADGTPAAGSSLHVQYATTDGRERVQAFFGQGLLRLGFRPDTAPGHPADTIAFIDGKGQLVLVTFSDRQLTWDPALEPQAVASPPPGAQTFFVIAVEAK